MAEGKKRESVMVRLLPETHYVLRIEAAKRGVTMKQLAEDSVRLYLETHPSKRRRPR